ncbi:DUF2141 domain-containing protein [Lewinella sp. W8]|uniref:DUF2141 domain-containing protein n=1 Tax=Lewinella sp. W8 TaxID=2528208 RepID=UPI001067A391|nr:DUF2141 domain-containing protein [Lewinella sp. W8]MTB52420.1 DUF2141 domain-containing protein [Lewinella sp. W8]
MLLLLFGLLVSAPAPQTVTVKVASSAPEGGVIYLAVYENADQFDEEAPAIGFTEKSAAGKATFSVKLPASGQYALAAYHDVNENGKLDKNFWGIPTEPYGFSVLPESKWRAPKFSDVSREFSPQDTQAKLELKRWKEY